MTKPINLIVVLGATASGKTALAAHVAMQFNGEIISADSRQVYRKMNLGTGKDYEDYKIKGVTIPYHLIDIVDPGYHYNVYEFQRDFLNAYEDITQRGKVPVLCGGSGMYIEAVLKGYKLIRVPLNPSLRNELEERSVEELTHILASLRKLHNTTDITDKKRAIRAVEIETFYKENEKIADDFPAITPFVLGVKFDRDSRRERITGRLKKRLDDGMINEVEDLLKEGLSPEQLIFYGLEYKYITQYVTGQLTYEEMFHALNTAIHQFAKRQMTWFRKMEKEGFIIHWLDGDMPLKEKLQFVTQKITLGK